MQNDTDKLRTENQLFIEKAELALRKLFDAAKAKNELHFALSLVPEFRGMRDAGWSSAEGAQAAFADYLPFLQERPVTTLKIRVALGFYCHLAEASGFYEIPKNMLRIVDGQLFNMKPFDDLVAINRRTGNRVAPNANKVIRDLAGHAKNLGHNELAEVFRDAFDPELRNGYSHADYVVWKDSIRLGLREGPLRKISYPEFNAIFERGVNFFSLLGDVVQENVTSYSTPVVIHAQLADEPEGNWTIEFDSERGTFGIYSGNRLDKSKKKNPR